MRNPPGAPELAQILEKKDYRFMDPIVTWTLMRLSPKPSGCVRELVGSPSLGDSHYVRSSFGPWFFLLMLLCPYWSRRSSFCRPSSAESERGRLPPRTSLKTCRDHKREIPVPSGPARKFRCPPAGLDRCIPSRPQ